MGTRKRRSDRFERAKMRSPGRPPVLHRSERRPFWRAIAEGCPSEVAAQRAGVSSAVGVRWFRECGGMPPSHLSPSSPPTSGRYLSLAEREQIALLRVQSLGVREIARQLTRSASTISRELRRNAATRSGGFEYRAITAQWHADRAARRPKRAKLAINAVLRSYVQDRLAGKVATPGGKVIAGPMVAWKGRRHGRRQHRRWARAWSPEQISHRLRLDFPDDESMRISHEAIYQALYVEGRGALKRELVACLRTGRALRVPRARSRQKAWAHVTPEVLISERPAEADDRAVPGHWEGDLLMGAQRSHVATLVERHSRYLLLVRLPARDSLAVTRALARRVRTLPASLRQSLTWDRGTELAAHTAFTVATDVQVYFCDPRSPWQRGSNENTNGLLRQYLSRRTDLSTYSQAQLNVIARQLNTRPRKTLGYHTPAEVLAACVAPTA